MFVQTKSSLLNNKSEDSCSTITFKTRTNKPTSIENKNKAETKATNRKEFDKADMKNLRYEIIKFGTSGFDGSKREESRVALAVSLGAKPPKNKRRNYTEILAEKKKRSRDVEQNTAKLSSYKGTTKRKRNSVKGKGGLLNSYGKIRPH